MSTTPPEQQQGSGWYDADTPIVRTQLSLHEQLLEEHRLMRAEIQALTQAVSARPVRESPRLMQIQQEQKQLRQLMEKLTKDMTEMQQQVTFLCNEIKSEHALELNRMIRTKQPIPHRPEHSTYAQPLVPLNFNLLGSTANSITSKLLSRMPSMPSTSTRTASGGTSDSTLQAAPDQ